MIPARSTLEVEERLKRVQMGDGHWGMFDPRTGIFTYEPPFPITFISFSIHLDTDAFNADGEASNDDAAGHGGHAPAPEGDVPGVRDLVEP